MKISIISSLILLLATASSVCAQTEDTVLIRQKAYMHSAAKREFVVYPYINPALNFYRQSYSLSILEAAGEWDAQDRAVQAEMGNGWKGLFLSGESYVHLSEKARAWGNAYYRNGTRRNVRWNESADHELVYPYVAADTIGGDMNSETYFFRGGYAAAYKQWTFGGEFSFRALQEYRDVDPRPNNKVADLYGKIGASRRIHAAYAAALSVEAHKYKQNGDLTYYDELGVSKTFHLTGLGNSYTRFDGTRTSVRYQGHRYGAGISLLPTEADGGWSGSFNYLYSFYEKILPAANDIPLNEIKENNLQAEVAWTRSKQARRFAGIKATMTYNDRKGTENLYGDAVNSIYPKIADAEQFGSRSLHAVLGGSYEQEQTARWRWCLQPAISYLQRKDTYKTPAKGMEYSLWNASLAFVSTHRWSKGMLRARIYGMCQGKIDATSNFGTQAAHPYALTVLKQNLEMQSGNRTGYGLSVRWSQNIGNTLGYAEAGWQQTRYSGNMHSRMLRASVGVAL